MEVRALRRGFDGRVLRSSRENEVDFVPEVFNFDGFRMEIDDDLNIKDNLGSWMELTDAGKKEYEKLAKSLKTKKKKELEKSKPKTPSS